MVGFSILFNHTDQLFLKKLIITTFNIQKEIIYFYKMSIQSAAKMKPVRLVLQRTHRLLLSAIKYKTNSI